MATITLAEASKLSLDDLVVGVIENIVTVNPIYNVMPFTDIDGNSLRYNREKTLGDSQALAIGGTITAKAASSYKQKNAGLTTLIGDAEVNGLIQSQRVGGDQVAMQIASKAKSVGRLWQSLMVNGDSAAPEEFDGLDAIIDEIVTEADNAQIDIDGANVPFTFESLDQLLHQVKSKDGQVDFLMMNEGQIRKLRALQRGLGGAQPEYVEVAGVNVASYAGVPVYRNDWIDNAGSPGGFTSLYAGNFDDGSQKVGVSGLTSVNNMGIHVQSVGAAETKDEDIYRIKFYSGFAAFSELGIARLKNVL